MLFYYRCYCKILKPSTPNYSWKGTRTMCTVAMVTKEFDFKWPEVWLCSKSLSPERDEFVLLGSLFKGLNIMEQFIVQIQGLAWRRPCKWLRLSVWQDLGAGSHWNTLSNVCWEYWIDLTQFLSWSTAYSCGPFITSTLFLQVLDSKRAELRQCHNLFTAETKPTACKISEAGKVRNICWDWEQLVARGQCSRRPAAHQFCPHLLLSPQLMLVVNDIFAEYRSN